MGTDHHQHGSDAGNAAWHRQLHHTGSNELSEDTAQTPGMRRYEAISGKRHGSRKLWMGKAIVAPGMVSGDHHHGEAETGIYVVSGHPVFVFLEDDEERRIEAGPGDYIYVPPYVPHREENPSPDEETIVVLARTTQEGIVVNLPSLRAEVPELDRLFAELKAEADG
ncbi:MAG TPA: cupin domain-containing protein [Gaiellales bacterium]|nr:cupin domain-containing protein [Gaiellales bacterium]